MYFKKGVENIEGKNKNIYQMEGSRKKYIKFQNQYIAIWTYKQSLKKKRGQKGQKGGKWECTMVSTTESKAPVPLGIKPAFVRTTHPAQAKKQYSTVQARISKRGSRKSLTKK